MPKYFGAGNERNDKNFEFEIFPRGDKVVFADQDDEDNEWWLDEGEAVNIIEKTIKAMNYINGCKKYELIKYNVEKE